MRKSRGHWLVIALCLWTGLLSAEAAKNPVDEALTLKKAGHVEKAISVLQGVLKEDPKDGHAHYVLAWCYVSVGKNDQALAHFGQAVKWSKDPQEVEEAKKAVGRILKKQGKLPASPTAGSPPPKPSGSAPAVAPPNPPAESPDSGAEEETPFPTPSQPGGMEQPGPLGAQPPMGMPGEMAGHPSVPASAVHISRALTVFGFVTYLFMAWCLMVIAQKTDTSAPWLAWIPVLNAFLIFMVARKPGWWFLLTFVPLVNVVVLVLAWMEIAEMRGKPRWMGVLFVLPVVNLILLGLLAFSE